MNLIGQKVDGKYEILASIGKGGMSEVFLARDDRLNQQWAVKVVQKNARNENNESVVQSALVEANLIKQFDHPSIVRIVDIVEGEDVFYIVEDFIEGKPFDKILDEYGAQPEENVVRWGMQICEALEYLHSRKPPIIYRDMKPANVMLKPDGNVKIIDFGIAREYKDSSLADTKNLGTMGYAAPEQFGGKGQTDPRTDVYCLGATLYHLVTGRHPMDEKDGIIPIRQINPQLDPGLEAIIQKCTQLNPADRYQNCAELLYALQHYRENGEAYRAMQKKKLIAFIATAAACLVFMIVGVFGLIMRTSTINSDYETIVKQAYNETDANKKIDYYLQAIDIKPNELKKDRDSKESVESYNAYFGLINSFKADQLFTSKEEELLLKKVKRSSFENDAASKAVYGELAYEIGVLYWTYYAGDKNQIENWMTCAKFSSKWFNDAMECGGSSAYYYNQAMAYYNIGKFHNEITLIDMEGKSDKGLYEENWNSINSLVEMLEEEGSNGDDSEMVRLQIYRISINSIGAYAYKFKRENIKQNDMNDLLKRVQDGYNTLKEQLLGSGRSLDEGEEQGVSKEKISLMREIESGMPIAKEAISKAFRG